MRALPDYFGAKTLIELRLPFPPSQNHLWMKTKNGMARTPQYRDWRESAGWQVKMQRPGKIEGPYKIHVDVARRKGRIDLDNVALKAVQDLLVEHQVIRDDSDCKELSASWYDGIGVTVRIEPL